MADPANVNRSVGSITNELGFLRDCKLLHPAQYQSIMSQLPQNGQQSQYIDFGRSAPEQQPPGYAQIAQQAQDPKNPAHPDNEHHHEWLKRQASKFGNAAVWGGGMTAGGRIVNDAMSKMGL